MQELKEIDYSTCQIQFNLKKIFMIYKNKED